MVQRQMLFVLQPFRSFLTIKIGPAKLSGRFSKTATHPSDQKRTIYSASPTRCLPIKVDRDQTWPQAEMLSLETAK